MQLFFSSSDLSIFENSFVPLGIFYSASHCVMAPPALKIPVLGISWLRRHTSGFSPWSGNLGPVCSSVQPKYINKNRNQGGKKVPNPSQFCSPPTQNIHFQPPYFFCTKELKISLNFIFLDTYICK